MLDQATTADPAERFCRFSRVCFVIAALAIVSICLRPAAVLVDKPFTEDGFYLLAVARNLALGNGLTIDGERLTNGIQPLFAFLAAPAYWLFGGDRVEGLRGVLFLHSLSFVAGAWWFGLVLRDAVRGSERLRWIGSLSWLGSGYFFLLSHNGLETGCLLCLYVAYMRLWQRWPLAGTRRALAHGALLGGLVLARIDATFFVTALLGLQAVRGERPFGERLRDVVVAGAVAVLVSSPWWIFNVVNFGALMPTSGAAQSGLMGETENLFASRTKRAAENVLLVATPVLYGGDGAGGLRFMILRGGLLLAVLFVLWRLAPLPRHAARSASTGRPVAIAVLVAGSVLVVYYAAFFWATHFYNRYYALLAPLGMAMWAVAAERVVARSLLLARLLALGLTAAAIGLAIVSHTGILFAGNEWLRFQVAAVREHVPPNARLAAGQSGTLGYFVDGVHNLDGKVNYEALRHQDSMGEYLAKYDIEWLCDWPVYLHRYIDPAKLRAEWERIDTSRYDEQHRGPKFELWRRRKP